MVSPSLASTIFRGCVNSAGMAKNVKKKYKTIQHCVFLQSRALEGRSGSGITVGYTFDGYNSPGCNRAGTALVHSGIAAADLPYCQPSLTACTTGEIPRGVPHQTAVFVPPDVTRFRRQTRQKQAASFDSLTVLQRFDDGGAPLWKCASMRAVQTETSTQKLAERLTSH